MLYIKFHICDDLFDKYVVKTGFNRSFKAHYYYYGYLLNQPTFSIYSSLGRFPKSKLWEFTDRMPFLLRSHQC